MVDYFYRISERGKFVKKMKKKIVCREKKHIYYKYITNIISKNDQTDGDASGYLL